MAGIYWVGCEEGARDRLGRFFHCGMATLQD